MTEANKQQRAEWNAESQATLWPRRERVTESVTAPLLAKLALHPGERVLEIGPGGGLAAIEAAKVVGPAGVVVGLDLSRPLVELATSRAAAARIDNVRFVAGDAQTDDISDAPFDVVMSQFGVMFFDDPVEAFVNIRRHMRPGARMAFACWQAAEKNAWWPGSVLAPYRAPQPSAERSGPPPGPFAFADPHRVSEILAAAGFEAVQHEPLSIAVSVQEDSFLDRELVASLRLEPAQAQQAWKDLQAFAASLRGPDGALHLAIAPQIVTAVTGGA